MRNAAVFIFVCVLAIAAVFYLHRASDDESIDAFDFEDSGTAQDLEPPRGLLTSVATAPVRVPVPKAIAARNHVIAFDNGRKVTIQMKHRPKFVPYYYPTERFIDIVDDLEKAALTGESAAAIQLARTLKACQSAYRSESELELELERIRTEGTIRFTAKNLDPQPIPPGFNYSTYEANLRRNQVLCEGLSDEQIDNRQDWLRLAVELGDYYGTRFLTAELGKTQESFELWQQAWDDGHINGVTALILYYRRGIPEYLDGRPDYVQTYAYTLIRNKVYEASNQYAEIPDSSRREAMHADLIGIGGYLSPHEQEEALNLAADILEANENCCYGTWRWDDQ